MQLKVVFMGSPEFAIPILQSLAIQYQVVGVVTQPDKPAGRGQQLTPPPVKALAQKLGIDTIQPRRLREPEAMDQLHQWRPDLMIVAAFGQILRQDVLDLPHYGCINVHASLLPRWRGAAPIQAAILSGDRETGVTIMRMDAGVDTGDILTQRSTPILDEDTTASLGPRLAEIGAQLLLDTLPGYLEGNLQPRPQDEAQATRAPMLKKEDGTLDFSEPATALALRVRALNPWPGTFTLWQGQILKVHSAHPVSGPGAQPGKTDLVEGLPAIGTSNGFLVLDSVQPAGKKIMEGSVFLRGARSWGTDRQIG